MAYSIRLTGVGKDGSTLLHIEPHWWEINELGKNVKLTWIKSMNADVYNDDDADISPDELRILHKQFKPNLQKEIDFKSSLGDKNDADCPYAKYVAELQSHLQLIDDALGKDASKYSRFHVCVFEWESGL